jgi:hypothetical protein
MFFGAMFMGYILYRTDYSAAFATASITWMYRLVAST